MLLSNAASPVNKTKIHTGVYTLRLAEIVFYLFTFYVELPLEK